MDEWDKSFDHGSKMSPLHSQFKTRGSQWILPDMGAILALEARAQFPVEKQVNQSPEWETLTYSFEAKPELACL